MGKILYVETRWLEYYYYYYYCFIPHSVLSFFYKCIMCYSVYLNIACQHDNTTRV